MLVLTRRDGEVVLVGNDIKITILHISNGQVKIGFEAPDEIEILREELTNEKQQSPMG